MRSRYLCMALLSGMIIILLYLRPFNNPFFSEYQQGDRQAIADTFLVYPYRMDGIITERGIFATFNDPWIKSAHPGLNCSGLVVSAARYMFHRNFSVRSVIKDSNRNSGRAAPGGEDWDFGWDLIFNISRGYRRWVFDQQLQRIDPAKVDPAVFRGISVYDRRQWRELFAALDADAVYFLAFNGLDPLKNDRLQYHHVGLMFKAGDKVLMYSASRKNPNRNIAVHDLTKASDLEQLIGQFTLYNDEHVIILEVFPKKHRM